MMYNAKLVEYHTGQTIYSCGFTPDKSKVRHWVTSLADNFGGRGFRVSRLTNRVEICDTSDKLLYVIIPLLVD